MPALDDASLQDAIAAMENIGRASLAMDLDLFQARRSIGKSHLMNEGLRCLSDLTGVFQELLDQVHASSNRSTSWSGIRTHYTALSRWLSIMPPSPIAKHLAEALSLHATNHNLTMNTRTTVGGYEVVSGSLSRTEAGASIGMSLDWFDAVAKHLGYRPTKDVRGRDVRYSRKQINDVRDTIRNTATVAQLEEQFSIAHQTVAAIFDEGLFIPLARPISWGNRTRCSRSDVDALLNTLRASYRPLSATSNDNLGSITAASIGTTGGFRQVLRWIYAGDLCVRAIDENAPGLRKFLVSRQEVYALCHVPSTEFMTANQAARALGMHGTAMGELIKKKIMPAERVGRNWHITTAGLSSFKEKYIRATELGNLIGIANSTTLRSLMRRHGVAPCCAMPEFRQSLYLRSEAMPVVDIIGRQQPAST